MYNQSQYVINHATMAMAITPRNICMSVCSQAQIKVIVGCKQVMVVCDEISGIRVTVVAFI